jgi:hypothetical protein
MPARAESDEQRAYGMESCTFLRGKKRVYEKKLLSKTKRHFSLKNNHDLEGDVTINENAGILLHTSVS